VIDKDSGLMHLRVDLSNAESSPVGWLEFGADVADTVSRCLSSLPDSEFEPAVRKILESAYRPGVSPVEAFLRMLELLFEGTGLVFANPLEPELRKLAQPTLIQAVRQNAEIRKAVMARSRALSDCGYHEQVKVDNTFTGLFAYRGKSRQPLGPEE